MRSGHGKGAGFERKCCVQLSLWVTGGKRRDTFWRSALSGGRATIGKRKGHDLSRQCGDICAIAPEGHALTDVFYFELKHYKDIRLESFILKGTGPISKWWKEACKQAKQHKRTPVLIARGNNMPIIVITKHFSKFNKLPVAELEHCDLGLFDRTLSQKFDPSEWK